MYGVYYETDILNALLAAEQATASALQGSGEVDASYTRGYAAGHRAALTTLALAFGLLDVTRHECAPTFLEDLEWDGKSSITNQSHNRKS